MIKTYLVVSGALYLAKGRKSWTPDPKRAEPFIHTSRGDGVHAWAVAYAAQVWGGDVVEVAHG